MIAENESHLSIYAFGPLGIQTETEVLGQGDLEGKKPRLLLERLLVGRNSVVHKSAIAEALWPRKAPQNASATIESYVSLLRKRLFTNRDLARQVIVTSSEGYRLNTDAIDLDLDRFDELTHRADTLGPGAKSLSLRLQADALRRGAVLEDARDVPWIEDVRYTYHDRASLNLEMIASGQLGSGNYVAAIRSAESAIDLEPYSEEAFRVVMLGQYALGHSSRARKTFERIRDLVWSDLAVDLTQVTEDVAAAIDAGEPPDELIDLYSRSAGTTGPITLRSNPHLAPADEDFRAESRRLPFLGRKAELASLRNFVTDGRDRGLQIAFVAGDQGMGKTEFLDRLEGLLSNEPGRTNYADLVGSREHHFADGFLRSLVRAGAYDMPVRGSTDQTSTPVNLQPLVDSLTRAGATTVLLDDLDLADDSDLLAIRWLQTNAPEVPLTVIATLGAGTLLETPEDGALTPDLKLELGPLTDSDVAPCGAAGKKVHMLCKGNPHFMADMWRWRAAGLSGPPESLLAYVERRVKAMNEPLVDALHILTKLCSPTELQGLVDQLEASAKTINRGLSILAAENALATVNADGGRGAA